MLLIDQCRVVLSDTHRDVLQVVAQLGGAGHRLSLGDPLLQLLHLLVELVHPVLLLQLGLAVLHHVLQGNVQPVYVGLLLGDLLAVWTQRKNATGHVKCASLEVHSIDIV